MQTALLDRQLDPVLRKMEQWGVRLDVGYLTTLAFDFETQLDDLKEQIFLLVGHPFLLSSPKQLSQVLFSELHLDEVEGMRLRRRTTGFSTDAAQLEKLRSAHPAIPLILEYRELGKLLSTYVQPLPLLVGRDGRLHTHYAPDAASGRLSSRQPNLQNIPIRTEQGRRIRRAFTAEPGWVLVAADYSQIQLKIIAHLAQDAVMIDLFRSGGDIHEKTSAALHVDRRTAKAVNFGIIYGLTAFGLAESLAVPVKDAQAFIDGFLATYPGVANYMQTLIAEARRQGYSETLMGKRRALPDLGSSNEFLRKAAERIALNHPIQGTEAEIMKLAMVELDRRLAKTNTSRMILQVHDELVFEVKLPTVTAIIPLIREVMTGAVQLDVPLTVAFKRGPNWAEMEKYLPEDAKRKGMTG